MITLVLLSVLRCPNVVCSGEPYVLDGDAAVSPLAPHSERVYQQDNKLSVLRSNRYHFSVRAVGGALGRMTQTHFVQKFLLMKTKKQQWFGARGIFNHFINPP